MSLGARYHIIPGILAISAGVFDGVFLRDMPEDVGCNSIEFDHSPPSSTSSDDPYVATITDSIDKVLTRQDAVGGKFIYFP